MIDRLYSNLWESGAEVSNVLLMGELMRFEELGRMHTSPASFICLVRGNNSNATNG